jgi:hypothetical protein
VPGTYILGVLNRLLADEGCRIGFLSTLEISIYSQMFDYSNIAFCLFREPDKGIKNKFLKTILAEASDHRGNVQKG